MKNIYQILFLVLLIHSGCSVFDNDSKPLEPIQTYFYAEINGERFDANGAIAVITPANQYSMLEFSGSHYYDEIYPYSESIILSILYNEGINTYSLNADSLASAELGFKMPGASYFENDGDLVISHFKKSQNSDGIVTVELEELEDGRKTISGTFEVTMYLSFRNTSIFPQRDQDTLHFTNGKFLLELLDRRED